MPTKHNKSERKAKPEEEKEKLKVQTPSPKKMNRGSQAKKHFVGNLVSHHASCLRTKKKKLFCALISCVPRSPKKR